MLNGFDIASVIPFAVASFFATIVLMLEVFQRQYESRAYLSFVTAIGAAATGASALLVGGLGERVTFGGMNTLDGFSSTLTILFALAAGLTALASPRYLEEQGVDRGEYYALILFATGGMSMMASAGDLVTFFVALEIQSVAIYALAAYGRRSAKSAEAGLKYFIIGAFASALLLYGIALVYGATGSTNLVEIGNVLSAQRDSGNLDLEAQRAILSAAAGFDASHAQFVLNFGQMGLHIPLVAVGMVLMLVAFFVKVAAVPFHFWAPDVYTGSPTSVVGFMAAAVKAAGFAGLVRVLLVAFFGYEMRMGEYGWFQIVFYVALASMVLGNLVAMVQKNVKRMLAYSSVAHAGYILVAVAAMGFGVGNAEYLSAFVFYAFAYTFGTVGAFAVLAYLGKWQHEAEEFEDLNGLGFKYPWLGAALSLFMLSSAGIPPSAGFTGKFLLFKAAIDAASNGAEDGAPGSRMLIALVVAGILTSVAGVYYYLKVLVHLYMHKPVKQVEALENSGAKFAIIVCALLTLWFGLFPNSLIETTSTDSAMVGATQADTAAADAAAAED